MTVAMWTLMILIVLGQIAREFLKFYSRWIQSHWSYFQSLEDESQTDYPDKDATSIAGGIVHMTEAQLNVIFCTALGWLCLIFFSYKFLMERRDCQRWEQWKREEATQQEAR